MRRTGAGSGGAHAERIGHPGAAADSDVDALGACEVAVVDVDHRAARDSSLLQARDVGRVEVGVGHAVGRHKQVHSAVVYPKRDLHVEHALGDLKLVVFVFVLQYGGEFRVGGAGGGAPVLQAAALCRHIVSRQIPVSVVERVGASAVLDRLVVVDIR